MLDLKSSTLTTSCEELIHWKRLWCWERLGAGGEGDDRGWDGWMASLTRWTRVLVNSGSWWWTGRPGMLQFMGSQGVRHDWATELNCTFFLYSFIIWNKFYLDLSFRASLVAQRVKNPPVIQETLVEFRVGQIPWRREWLPTPFWPGGFRGLYSPWVCKELDSTEQISQTSLCFSVAKHVVFFCYLLNWSCSLRGCLIL